MSPDDFERRFYVDHSRPQDIRGAYARDMGRVIHSSAFRRLQGKTQVTGPGEGDFHRTRLTHSIETAQIGQGIARILRDKSADADAAWLPDDDLVAAACYAHDLGHPPHGHAGEEALHAMMVNAGGFEGNAQTLRILVRLEEYHEQGGINPTRRLLLAVLKYPVAFGDYSLERQRGEKPPKCYYDSENDLVNWALEPFSATERELLCARPHGTAPCYRTLDASIMDIADEITYSTHDLEDAVARSFISREYLLAALEKSNYDIYRDELQKHYADRSIEVDFPRRDELATLFNGGIKRKHCISKLIHAFILATELIDRGRAKSDLPFNHPLLRLYVRAAKPASQLMELLRTCVYNMVIDNPVQQRIERRGRRIIGRLFRELLSAYKQLIPKESLHHLQRHPPHDARQDLLIPHRLVCDYVASMSDSYLDKSYNLLFTPGYGTSRDEL